MSVVVRGMDIPTHCQYCGFMRYYHENGNIWCNANSKLMKQGWYAEIDIKRPKDCPLFELKDWRDA